MEECLDRDSRGRHFSSPPLQRVATGLPNSMPTERFVLTILGFPSSGEAQCAIQGDTRKRETFLGREKSFPIFFKDCALAGSFPFLVIAGPASLLSRLMCCSAPKLLSLLPTIMPTGGVGL